VDESEERFTNYAKKFRGTMALYRIRSNGQKNISREMDKLGVTLDPKYRGGIPLFVFLDEKGNQITSFAGGPSYKALDRMVGQMLREQS
jgi:hypothetical protein